MGNPGIDGDNILYHYFHIMFKKKDQFALLERLITDLSIWLPRSLYRKLPVILPYVVRDPSCRRRRGQSEEWGSANSQGFLRDDNSLIKSIVNSFTIKSPRIKPYDGSRKGRGFVASHVWRIVRINNSELISNRHHMLNSFVPNLAWLPRQIAKLTDREGSSAQKLLQAISHRIYDGVHMPREISDLWNYLPYPMEYESLETDVSELSFFTVKVKWIERRTKTLISEIDRITSLAEDHDPETKKVKCSRYLPSLAKIPKTERQGLERWLTKYRDILSRLADD